MKFVRDETGHATETDDGYVLNRYTELAVLVDTGLGAVVWFGEHEAMTEKAEALRTATKKTVSQDEFDSRIHVVSACDCDDTAMAYMLSVRRVPRRVRTALDRKGHKG